MAVPKSKRSKSKVKQRTNIIFFDQLCGNWRRRREWFYKRLSIEKFLPTGSEGKFGTNRPVLFPGFWSRYNQIRKLGQAPQGNNIDNIESAWEEAKRLFYKPSYSYQEFSKRVECARLFLFWGVVTGLALDLLIRPLKTNYWFNWNFKDKFTNKEPASLPPLNENHMTDASMEYNRICNF